MNILQIKEWEEPCGKLNPNKMYEFTRITKPQKRLTVRTKIKAWWDDNWEVMQIIAGGLITFGIIVVMYILLILR